MSAIICPYCWQRIDIESPEFLDSNIPAEFIADCEVCCRPIRVTAYPDPSGAPPELQAEPDN